MAQAKKLRIKYKNVSIALALILIVILSISTACSNDDKKDKKILESSSVEQTESKVEEKTQAKNFKYVTVENDKALGKGVLALVNEKNPWKLEEADSLDGVYGYMFDKDKNQVCRASSTNVQGKKSMLKAFNSMMSAFYADSNNDNVVINSIYSGNSDDEKKNSDSQEHITGYAIDLNTYNPENGTFPTFKADGEYRWIGENCWKFGFIKRYESKKASITGVDEKTNHFRFVGKVNAEIMHKNDMCLEEYVDYLKKYSVDKPLEFQCENGAEYMLYYVPETKDKSIKLPVVLNDNGDEYKYDYSGNNVDGYVVWVKISDEIFDDDSSSKLKIQSSVAQSESENNSSEIEESTENESQDNVG